MHSEEWLKSLGQSHKLGRFEPLGAHVRRKANRFNQRLSDRSRHAKPRRQSIDECLAALAEGRLNNRLESSGVTVRKLIFWKAIEHQQARVHVRLGVEDGPR